VAPPPSPRSQCWEGGGFGPCADGAPASPRSERWCEAELSACCAAAASSSAFSCWRTRRSSEVAASGQPRSSMAAAARFCDACLKSGGASGSALASMFAPSLARRLLSHAGLHVGGIGARPCGRSAVGRRSCRSSFPSQGSSYTGMSCAGRRLHGVRHPSPVLGEEGPTPRQAGASPPRARRAVPASGRRRRGAGSGSELLDAEATQT
jgi:hypothetical protein